MDPELEPFIPLLPETDMTDPVATRAKFAERAAARPAPEIPGMQIEDRTVPATAPGDPDVPIRVYRPQQAHGAVIWLHGGGFVFGDLDTEHPWATRIADGSGAVVISVGYRRSPEHPFPAALNDAYAVLNWTAEHAAELGVCPDLIAIGGHSAGAGLAAAVALRSRDEQGPPIRFQLLNQPGLDDRQETWSSGTSRTPPGTTAPNSPRPGATTWRTTHPPRTQPRPAPQTCPASHPRTSRAPSSTRYATRRSTTPCACSRRASR